MRSQSSFPIIEIFPRVLIVLLTLVSLSLFFYGLATQSWSAGLGLLLLIISIIGWSVYRDDLLS